MSDEGDVLQTNELRDFATSGLPTRGELEEALTVTLDEAVDELALDHPVRFKILRALKGEAVSEEEGSDGQ